MCVELQSQMKIKLIDDQGRLFFYYSPQTLGNNFSTLGKNSKFWGGGKKEKKVQRK